MTLGFLFALRCLLLVLLVAAAAPFAAQAQTREIDALLDRMQQFSDAGRHADALPIAERLLPMIRNQYGEASSWYSMALNNVAFFNMELGRLAQAEPFYREAIAVGERARDPDVAKAIGNLAHLYKVMGRYAEAEPLFLRSVAMLEKNRGDVEGFATALGDLGAFYSDTGRKAEAEPLLRRALALNEKSVGSKHPSIASSLNNLATVIEADGRMEEAGALYLRALQISAAALGENHPVMATRYNNLAELLRVQKHFTEAEMLFKKGIAVAMATGGENNTDLAMCSSNLGKLYTEQKRFAEAEQLLRRAQAITEKAFGPEHPNNSVRLHNLASALAAQGKSAEAETLLLRALSMKEHLYGPDHPNLVIGLSYLANVQYAQKKWSAGLEHARRATRIVMERANRGGQSPERLRDRSRIELAIGEGSFSYLVQGAWHVSRQWGASQATLMDEAFQANQLAEETAAGEALAMLAARDAPGDPALGALARERQDLATQGRQVDTRLLGATADAKGGASAKTALSKQLAGIDDRIAAIDRELQAKFPKYAVLTRPAAIPLAQVTPLIDANEAVVQFARIENEMYVWVISHAGTRWAVVPEDADSIGKRLDQVTCGVNANVWAYAGERCQGKTPFSKVDAEAGRPLPFDLVNAFELYKVLFGQVEPLLKNADGTWKHLLVVPGGLVHLPFNALVTEDPSGSMLSRAADYQSAKWLGTRQPLTILPSLGSLKALRAAAKASRPARAYLAVGNPLLDGDKGDAQHVVLAQQTRAAQTCADAIRISGRPAVRAPTIPRLEKTGRAELAYLRSQLPLPETAGELCEVAKSVNASDADVLLGARATEATIKGLSSDGRLADYRVVHFATHGALSGEVTGSAEPGLILTPPRLSSSEDDGYLTASEIARLKLNADWVILSACNTAGAAGNSGQALSGLARAFFYAGARALLVSHWAVNSAATVDLVTDAVAGMKADPKIGRAEAMQHAMRKLVARSDAGWSHPSYWAPFVVVGEGSATR